MFFNNLTVWAIHSCPAVKKKSVAFIKIFPLKGHQVDIFRVSDKDSKKISISHNICATFAKLVLIKSLYKILDLNAVLKKMLSCIIMNINEQSLK